MPSGNAFCGLIVSPAENVTYCQPSYAHSTAITAIPAAASMDVDATLLAASAPAAVTAPAAAAASGSPYAMSAMLSSTIAPTLNAVIHVCTAVLLRAPQTLMHTTAKILAGAATVGIGPGSGTSCPRYPVAATASGSIATHVD